MPRRSPDCRRRRPSCGGIFDFDAKEARLATLSREFEDPALWANQQRAQDLGREKKSLEAIVGTLKRVGGGLADARELFELARAEGDDATLLSVSSDTEKLKRDRKSVV